MTPLHWLDRIDRVSLLLALERSGMRDGNRWAAGIGSATTRESLIAQCRQLVNWTLPEGTDPVKWLTDSDDSDPQTLVVRVCKRIETAKDRSSHVTSTVSL